MDERMPTGILGLDEAVHGGLITQNSYLIVGGPGTGKTILSFQWLLEGVRRGESAHLAKPVDQPLLLRAIDAALSADG